MNTTQYFDEMYIMQTDKDRRTAMASEMSAQLKERFNDIQTSETKDITAIEEILIAVFIYILFKYFSITDDVKPYVLGYTNKLDIDKNSKQLVDIVKGNLYDISNTTAEQFDKAYTFSDERADTIAVNETNILVNTETQQIALEMGYTHHKWVTMEDERVRKTHKHANGQIKPINKPFTVGKYKLMYPMDESLGAGAEEIVNCRCVEVFLNENDVSSENT